MRAVIAQPVASILWGLQAEAFACHLYAVGAWSINRYVDVCNWGGFDWADWGWANA